MTVQNKSLTVQNNLRKRFDKAGSNAKSLMERTNSTSGGAIMNLLNIKSGNHANFNLINFHIYVSDGE